MVATGGLNSIINLYQIDKLNAPKYLKGHRDGIKYLQFFSSNKNLVSVSDSEVILWDV